MSLLIICALAALRRPAPVCANALADWQGKEAMKKVLRLFPVQSSQLLSEVLFL